MKTIQLHKSTPRPQFARAILYSGAALIAASFALASMAHAAVTPAGTNIENVATATYDTSNGTVTVDSNTNVILVDELLDVVVTNTVPGDISTAPNATGNVSTFRVTNSGNGNESFALTTNVARGGDQFDPSLQQIVIDNGNGVYDPGVDTVYVPGTNNPLLAPGASVVVFVLTNTPSGVANGSRGEVSLIASAVTGTGAPGTTFATLGDNGSDAVVGNTRADGEDFSTLLVQAATIRLTKSATIVDPFGGNNAVPGSVITYTLLAEVAGAGTLNNVVIGDIIPAGTDYTLQSITYENAALTDETDSDAGTFNGTRVAVNAGSISAGSSRTVKFKVRIK
jgi:uncharacterized repeat protein (TIGR01451 family)